MPIYPYRCENGHYREIVSSIHAPRQALDCAFCGLLMEQVICAPLMVTAQQECRYDSPIDGTPITSWAQRRDDLARNGCRPYDPEMKTDYTNRLKREDEALDKAIHASVEEAVEKMPSKKRAALASDLIDKGATLAYTRATPTG